jgi:GDSL-like Lipase/Acylhydrolase family
VPRWSAKHPLLRVLLVLGCLVVTLGVAELVLRIVDYAELHVPPDSVLYGPDAELGWSLVPNRSTQSTSGNRTIPVEINSLGLREREFTDARPGTFIFIGDSFTFGYDAEPNERFSDLLQQALPQYRMINAGVSGYGTDQQYLLLQRLWKHVRPQVVVLTVCVDNDRDDNSSSFRYRRYYKPYFARTPEGEWQVRGYPLPPSKRQLFTGNVWAENSLLVRFAIYSYIAIRHAEVIVPDPTEHLINMVRRTADARGARLVVGLQRHEPRLEAYLRAQGIPFTSFDDAKGYPTAGWHWTPEGNAVVAARYLALFTELGIASSLAPPASGLAEVDRIGRMLEQMEAAVEREGSPAEVASDIGETLDPLRAALRAMIAEGGARLDAASTQARLLAVRADRLAERVAERRAFHRYHPFEQTPGVLSPLIWLAAARALPGELGGLGHYVEKWAIAVWDSGGVQRGATVLLTLMVLGIAALMLWFSWQRRAAPAAGEPTRFAKAASSFGVFLGLALTTPLALLAVTEALQVRMVEISYGLTAALFIAMFGYAVALGALAPDAPSRRLIAIDDETARTLARHLVWGAQALALLVVVLAVHKALVAPASLTVATNMLYALAVGGILLHLLLATRRGGGTGGFPRTVPWLRALGWSILAVIVIALLAGYACFAAFVATRLVSVAAVLGVLYLLLVLTNAFFAERRARDARRSGPSAGITFLYAGLGVMLAGLFVAIGPW